MRKCLHLNDLRGVCCKKQVALREKKWTVLATGCLCAVCLEENREDFKLFRQAASKRGFTEQIGDLLKEFSRYCLDFKTMNDLHGDIGSSQCTADIA